jgi:hypothetical protein
VKRDAVFAAIISERFQPVTIAACHGIGTLCKLLSLILTLGSPEGKGNLFRLHNKSEFFVYNIRGGLGNERMKE